MQSELLQTQGRATAAISFAPVVHWQYESSRLQLVSDTAFVKHETAQDGMFCAAARPARAMTAVVVRSFMLLDSGV